MLEISPLEKKYFYTSELFGEVFDTYNSTKMISSFNNLLDLVVMLELGGILLLPKHSQATCTDVNIL